MSAADRERWDERYRSGPPAPGAGPPPLLEAAEPWLGRGGGALDLACGLGRAALWLAERGFAVDAVDISPVALAALVAEAEARGLGDRVRVLEADLDDGLPAEVTGPYEVVVCLLFRYRPLGGLVAGPLLRPGGLVVASVLSQVGRTVGEGPGPDPRFLAEEGELLERFGGFDVLHHDEGDGQAGIVARKPTVPA